MKKNLFKISIALYIATFSATKINAQKDIKKNSIYAEIGGNGVLYSINYERLFKLSKLFNVTSRIGYGYTDNFNFNKLKTNSIPFEINGLFSLSKEKHFIEIGSGVTYMYIEDQSTESSNFGTLIYAARLGYRYQKPNGGIMYRIGITPLYDFYSDQQNLVKSNTWFIFGGISIGYNF